MKVTFISSQLTEHQIPFCEAMQARCERFCFVQMNPAQDVWEGKGGTLYRKDYPYLKVYDEETADCRAAIESADVLLVSVPYQPIVKDEIRRGVPTFVYMERFFKNKKDRRQMLKTVLGSFSHHRVYEKYKPLLLCASGFCAQDAHKLGLYRNRCYKWGYFPKLYAYDADALWQEKQKNEIPHILWVGRLIDWKHPDDAVLLAKRLKDRGCRFHLDMLGVGEMEPMLHDMVEKLGLQAEVTLHGAKLPEEVRRFMERANVFLTTSDFGEGWGAVVNEAMNSACAVVASHAVGSVPFLLEDGKNGLVYRSGDLQDLTEKTAALLENPELTRQYGINAYKTVAELWNADAATQRLLGLMQAVVDAPKTAPDLFADGPCSKAETLEDEWVHS